MVGPRRSRGTARRVLRQLRAAAIRTGRSSCGSTRGPRRRGARRSGATSRRLNVGWQQLLERTIVAGIAEATFRCDDPHGGRVARAVAARRAGPADRRSRLDHRSRHGDRLVDVGHRARARPATRCTAAANSTCPPHANPTEDGVTMSTEPASGTTVPDSSPGRDHRRRHHRLLGRVSLGAPRLEATSCWSSAIS